MNRKQIYMLRALCGPYAFLEARRRTDRHQHVVLVQNWKETKLTIGHTILLDWLSKGLVTRSAHTVESYLITDAGRALVSRYDERDAPLSMQRMLEVQAMVRAARR